MQKSALYFSGAFFAVGALAHAVRLFTGMEIVVGGMDVPVWFSVFGVLAAAGLSFWMFLAARR
jgi:hypothetical protein